MEPQDQQKPSAMPKQGVDPLESNSPKYMLFNWDKHNLDELNKGCKAIRDSLRSDAELVRKWDTALNPNEVKPLSYYETQLVLQMEASEFVEEYNPTRGFKEQTTEDLGDHKKAFLYPIEKHGGSNDPALHHTIGVLRELCQREIISNFEVTDDGLLIEPIKQTSSGLIASNLPSTNEELTMSGSSMSGLAKASPPVEPIKIRPLEEMTPGKMEIRDPGSTSPKATSCRPPENAA